MSFRAFSLGSVAQVDTALVYSNAVNNVQVRHY
jgi:hypothetical protein